MTRRLYQDIVESDLGAGIDAQSAENRLQPSYCERLINVDPTPDGRLRKRAGRQAYKGHIPLRVETLTYSHERDVNGDNVTLTFDSSISLASVRQTPIYLYGRTSKPQAGTIKPVNEYIWRESFNVVQPVQIEVGPNTVVIPGTVHGIPSKYLEIVTLEADSLGTYSNSQIEVDSVKIDASTYDVTLELINGTGTPFNIYVAIADRRAVASETYISDAGLLLEGRNDYLVQAYQHQLENFNIMTTVYMQDGAGDLTLIEPDEVTISPTGDVTVTLENNTGTYLDRVIIIAHRAPSSQVGSGTLPAVDPTNPDNVIHVSVPNVKSQFNSVRIYIEETPGSTWQEVKADEVKYNEVSSTLQFSFINNSPISANFYFLYDYAYLFVNSIRLELDGINPGEDYVEEEPHLVIYGLDQEQIYGNIKPERAGWVNHIDLYKSALEQKLVVGLGGVLHEETNGFHFIETPEDSARYVNIRGRVDGMTQIAPAFQVDPPIPSLDRTRGTLIASNVDDRNRLPIVRHEWDPLTELIKITLLAEDYVETQPLTSIINTVGNLKDYLTIEESPWKATNGDFRIESVTGTVDGSNLLIELEIKNGSIDDSDWNFEEAGFAAIRTDTIKLLRPAIFIPGDQVKGETFSEWTPILGVADYEILVGDLHKRIAVPSGIRLVGKRRGRCVPLRSAKYGDSDIGALTKGDSMTVTGQVRTHKVNGIVVAYDRAVTVTGNGERATVTAEERQVRVLEKGTRFLLTSSLTYAGEWEVDTIINSTTFTFKHPGVGTESATILGSCITIGEEIEIEDRLSDDEAWRVEGRFQPIDIPYPTQSMAPRSKTYMFDSRDYTGQTILRSTLMSDAMFLTNGEDPVMKYDGTSLYRAGLFRWQSRLFATRDTQNTNGKITLNHPKIGLDGYFSQGATFKLDPTKDSRSFNIGDKIEDLADNKFYTILNISESDKVITVDRTISGTGNRDIIRTTEFSYYMRLNMIDANGYVVASASSGTDETRVTLGENAAIRLRLLCPPPLGIYDYDRIEVEVYRRHDDSDYGRIRTISIPFEEYDNYIDIIDTDAPDVVVFDVGGVAANRDQVVSVLDSDGLGQAWGQIPKAKYITSAGGSLILANIKSYPEIRLDWTRKVQDITDTDLVASGNSILTLRRDESDGSNVTDMINVARYEWKPTTSGVTITKITNRVEFDSTKVNVANNEITAKGQLLYTGDVIRLHKTGGNLPGGLAEATDYYLYVKDEDTIKLATSKANLDSSTFVDITSSGSTGETFSIRATGRARGMTISGSGLNLSKGDWVYLFHSDEQPDHCLQYAGYYQVASNVSSTTLRVRALNDSSHTPDSYDVDKVLVATDPKDIPVPVGLDGNYNTRRGQAGPFRSLPIRVAVIRLANAINASMRCVDRKVNNQEEFTPWITAAAGGEFDTGHMTLTQPENQDVQIGAQIDSLNGAFRVYGNEIGRAAGSKIEAESKLFPSRVLISETNHAEIFDAPLNAAEESKSAVDINPSDGQQITAIMPFFGESTSGSAQKASTVIVFKTSSIYVLDIRTRAYQKIDSQGLGCTLPYSVAYTKDAIMFANTAGIYRLNQNMQIEYIGQKLDRLWSENTGRTESDVITGHHYAEGKQYKVSVPRIGERANSTCYVYSHTREYMSGSAGSWTEYDNTPATGWVNQEEKAYMASTLGKVYKVRSSQNERPYRDDDAPIKASALLRAMDFGAGGTRKAFGPVTIHYRTDKGASTGTTIHSATDMSRDFKDTDVADIVDDSKMQSVQYSLADRHGNYIQIRIDNNKIDESMEVSSVNYSVAGVSKRGIGQARDPDK